MIRRIFVLACTVGGIWGALHLLGRFAKQVSGADEFSISGEGALLAIPIGMVGALVGALVGAILYPNRP